MDRADLRADSTALAVVEARFEVPPLLLNAARGTVKAARSARAALRFPDRRPHVPPLADVDDKEVGGIGPRGIMLSF
jgi:hypothetical protein